MYTFMIFLLIIKQIYCTYETWSPLDFFEIKDFHGNGVDLVSIPNLMPYEDLQLQFLDKMGVLFPDIKKYFKYYIKHKGLILDLYFYSTLMNIISRDTTITTSMWDGVNVFFITPERFCNLVKYVTEYILFYEEKKEGGDLKFTF
ncbi:hypothetical protein SLOPH_998 [Spraguea lophii 42_110]|uniref:Uncharacterized protein n=1 Tax=Spraguea lophii (strain 42_110) TaxID=1358809 RepID=S7W7K7_SPRLO|nr:hypothetical protein SLOPH_998 [Spraguea lophii 42_110]